MSLQLIARAKATVHLWRHFAEMEGHRIWRVYRWWGWDTKRVICTCGIEFTKRPTGSPDVAWLLAEIKMMRARYGR